MSFEVALAEEIWTAKYRFMPPEGSGDESFAETRPASPRPWPR